MYACVTVYLLIGMCFGCSLVYQTAHRDVQCMYIMRTDTVDTAQFLLCVYLTVVCL